jgi:hypothetical protein
MASEEQLNNQRTLNELLSDYQTGLIEAADFASILTSRSSQLVDSLKQTVSLKGKATEEDKAAIKSVTKLADITRSLQTPYENISDIQKDIRKNIQEQQKLENTLGATKSRFSKEQLKSLKDYKAAHQSLQSEEKKLATLRQNASKKDNESADRLFDMMGRGRELKMSQANLEQRVDQDILNAKLDAIKQAEDAEQAALDDLNAVRGTYAEDYARDLLKQAQFDAQITKSKLSAQEEAYANVIKERQEVEAQIAAEKDIVSEKALQIVNQERLTSAARDTHDQLSENLSEEEKFVLELEKAIELANKNNEYLRIQETLQKNITKAMSGYNLTLGFAGNLMDKLGASQLKSALNLDKAQEAAEKRAKELTNQGKTNLGIWGKLQVAGAGFTEVLRKSLTVQGLLLAGITAIVNLYKKGEDTLKAISAATKEIAKDLGVTTDVARGLVNRFDDIAFLTGQMPEEAAKLTAEMQNLVGTTKDFGKEQQVALNQLVASGGYSLEQATRLLEISELQGQSLEDNYKTYELQVLALNEQTDSAVSVKSVIQEIGTASAEVRANIAANGGNFAKAAFEAKKLGLELTKVQDIGKSQLDFEGSLRKELEAEAILGKDINLERFRQASLTGDAATIAEELNRLVAENYDNIQGSTLAQQAFADMLGISVDEVMNIGENMKLLSGTGYKDLNKAQEKYNKLVESGAGEQEIANEFQNEALRDKLAQISYEEKLAAYDREKSEQYAKITEAFQPLVDKFRELAVRWAPIITDFVLKLEPYITAAGEALANFIGSTMDFFEENPWLGKLAGGGVLALAASNSLRNMFGDLRGRTRFTPQYVHVTNPGALGGGGGLPGSGGSGKLGKLMKVAGTAFAIYEGFSIASDLFEQAGMEHASAAADRQEEVATSKYLAKEGSNAIKQTLESAAENGKSFFSQTFDNIKVMGKEAFDGVKDTITKTFSGQFLTDIKNSIGEVKGSIIDAFKGENGVFSQIKAGTKSFIEGAQSTLSKAADMISNPAATARQAAGAVSDMVSSAGSSVSSMGKSAWGAVTDFGSSAMNTLSSAGQSVVKGAQSVGEGAYLLATNPAKWLDEVLSPSLKSVTSEVGTSLFKGVKGLAKKIPIVGPLIDLGFGAYEVSDILNSNDIESENDLYQRIGEAASGTLGSMVGGGIGAAIGSAVAPGIGTLIGGIGGGFLGDWFGRWLANQLGATGLGEWVIDSIDSAGIASKSELIGNIQNVQDGYAPAERGPFTITDKYGEMAVTAVGDSVLVTPNITNTDNLTNLLPPRPTPEVPQSTSETFTTFDSVNDVLKFYSLSVSSTNEKLIKYNESLKNEIDRFVPYLAQQDSITLNNIDPATLANEFGFIVSMAKASLADNTLPTNDVINLDSLTNIQSQLIDVADGYVSLNDAVYSVTGLDLTDFFRALVPKINIAPLDPLPITAIQPPSELISSSIITPDSVSSSAMTQDQNNLVNYLQTNRGLEGLAALGITSITQKESKGQASATEGTTGGKYYNTSIDRIRKIFPTPLKNTTDDQLKEIQRLDKEEGGDHRFFNLVYGNRAGNLGSSTDDGWNFRGRGLIQLTGRTNYTKASNYIFGDDTLINYPDKAASSEIASQIVDWFLFGQGKSVTDIAQAGGADLTPIDGTDLQTIMDATYAKVAGKSKVEDARKRTLYPGAMEKMKKFVVDNAPQTEPYFQKVADAASISNNGPFTIQDSRGNLAITHPNDKLVVSPNVSYVSDGISGKGGPVFPVSENFGALDVKVGKSGVMVQKIKDGVTGGGNTIPTAIEFLLKELGSTPSEGTTRSGNMDPADAMSMKYKYSVLDMIPDPIVRANMNKQLMPLPLGQQAEILSKAATASKVQDGFTGLQELREAEEAGMPIESQPGAEIIGVRGPFTPGLLGIKPIQVGSRTIKGAGVIKKAYGLDSEENLTRKEIQQEWLDDYRIAYQLSKKGINSRFAKTGIDAWFRTINFFERLVKQINRTEQKAIKENVPLFFYDFMAKEEERGDHDTIDYGTAIQRGLTEGSAGPIRYGTDGRPSYFTMGLNTFLEPSKLYKDYTPPTPEPEVAESILPERTIVPSPERVTIRGTEGKTFVTYENGEVVDSSTLEQQRIEQAKASGNYIQASFDGIGGLIQKIKDGATESRPARYTAVTGTTSSTRIADSGVISQLGVKDVTASNYRDLFTAKAFISREGKPLMAGTLLEMAKAQTLHKFKHDGSSPSLDSFIVNYLDGQTDQILNSGTLSFPAEGKKTNDIDSISASGNGLLALARAITELGRSSASKYTIGFRQSRESSKLSFNSDEINNLSPTFNSVKDALLYKAVQKQDDEYVTGIPTTKSNIKRLGLGVEEYIVKLLDSTSYNYIPLKMGQGAEVYDKFNLGQYDYSEILNVISKIQPITRYKEFAESQQGDKLSYAKNAWKEVKKAFVPQYVEHVLSFIEQIGGSQAYERFESRIQPTTGEGYFPDFWHLFKKVETGTSTRSGASLSKAKGEYSEGSIQRVQDGITEMLSDPKEYLENILGELGESGLSKVITNIFTSPPIKDGFTSLTKNASKRLPFIGPVIESLIGGYKANQAIEEYKNNPQAPPISQLYQELGSIGYQTIGGTGGSLIGGLALTPIMGPIGTFAGSVVGGLIGQFLGSALANTFDATTMGKAISNVFLSTPQQIQDGSTPAARGPFTITDRFGATAVTAKGDGVVVSPNISYVNDGISNATSIGDTMATEVSQHTTIVESSPTDTSALEKEVKDLKEIMASFVEQMNQVVNRPIVVEMDGNEVGRGLGNRSTFLR